MPSIPSSNVKPAPLTDSNRYMGHQQQGLTNVVIADGDIVVPSGMGGGYVLFVPADADDAAASRSLFGVARGRAAGTATAPASVRVAQFAVITMNTAASAVWAPVFLSGTAGVVTLTEPVTGGVVVGRVLTVAASGRVLLAPALQQNAPVSTRTVAESAAVAGAEAALAGGARTLPANALRVGSAIGFHALIRVAAVSGAPTAQVRVRLGVAGVPGTLVFDTTARTVADEDLIVLEGWLGCRAVGAAGTLTGYCKYMIGAADALASAAASEWATDVAGSASGTWTVAVNTTLARDFTLTGQTDAAGTQLQLEFLRLVREE